MALCLGGMPKIARPLPSYLWNCKLAGRHPHCVYMQVHTQRDIYTQRVHMRIDILLSPPLRPQVNNVDNPRKEVAENTLLVGAFSVSVSWIYAK